MIPPITLDRTDRTLTVSDAPVDQRSKDTMAPSTKEAVRASKTMLIGKEESTIPTLDLNEFYCERTRDKFVEKLRKACHEVGFFAITHAGISSDIIDQAYEKAKEVFELHQEVKNKYDGKENNYQKGYGPLGNEKAKGKPNGDNKEYWHIGPEESDVKNIWPKEIDLKTPVTALYEKLAEFMIPIQKAFLASLGISDDDYFFKMTEKGDNIMRIIHYPHQDYTEDGVVWASEHTDIDLFTILPRATEEGLEVQDRSGKWIRVIVPDNAFIVNCGDMLENITNGYFRSARHRVVSSEIQEKESTERLSIVLFVHPTSESDCSPHPNCVEKTGEKKLYPDATRLDMLAERIADLGYATEKMLKHLRDCGIMEQRIAIENPSVDAMLALKEHGFANETVLKELEKRGL